QASIYSFCEDEEVLRPALKRLDKEIKERQSSLANFALRSRQDLIENLVDLRSSRGDSDDDDADSDETVPGGTDDQQPREAAQSDKRRALELLFRAIEILAVSAGSDQPTSRR